MQAARHDDDDIHNALQDGFGKGVKSGDVSKPDQFLLFDRKASLWARKCLNHNPHVLVHPMLCKWDVEQLSHKFGFNIRVNELYIEADLALSHYFQFSIAAMVMYSDLCCGFAIS